MSTHLWPQFQICYVADAEYSSLKVKDMISKTYFHIVSSTGGHLNFKDCIPVIYFTLVKMWEMQFDLIYKDEFLWPPTSNLDMNNVRSYLEQTSWPSSMFLPKICYVAKAGCCSLNIFDMASKNMLLHRRHHWRSFGGYSDVTNMWNLINISLRVIFALPYIH